MSMISELVEKLRVEAKSMGKYGTDYMATLLTRSADTIEMLSEKVRADRPQGEWEIEYRGNGWNDYWDYICSNCGKKYERADAVLYKANFCPNCGAKMKGEDDEMR